MSLNGRTTSLEAIMPQPAAPRQRLPPSRNAPHELEMILSTQPDSQNLVKTGSEGSEGLEAALEGLETPSDALDRVTDAFYAVDREWRFTYLNAHAETVLRRTRDDLLGKNLWKEFPQAVGSPFQEHFQQAVTEQRSVFFEEYYPPLDLWAEVRAYPSPSGLSVYFTDAGPRRRREEELRQAEEALRAEHEFSTTVLESVGALLVVLDGQGRIVAFNRTAEEKTGYTAEEVKGRAIFELFIPEDERSGVTRTFQDLLSESGDFQSEYENSLLDRAGNRVRVSWRNTALRNPDGSLRYIVATGVDVTAERQRERLNEALGRINLELGTLDPDEILQNLVIEGGRALGSELAMVTMREDEGWLVRYAAGQDESLVARLLESTTAPVSLDVESERRAIAIPDVRAVSYAASSFAREVGLTAVLAAPFFRRGSLTGLVVFYFPGPRPITEPEIDFAEKLAAAVTLALENARLYQAQLRIAQELQESLLTVPEKIEGVRFAHLYRSATHAARVGGDFYDLFSVADGRVGLVIGDVSGHGVEAAALASLVKDTIRAYAYQRSTPEAVLHLTNQALVRRTQFQKFVTVFFGLLEVGTGKLAYSSAGHPPALVLRKSREVERLKSAAPPLSSFGDSLYATSETTLEPGELLLLYTDGVIEARSAGGGLFGEQRLADLLASRQTEETRRLPGVIFRAVRTFAEGTLNDDVALLALKLEEPEELEEPEAGP